MKKLVTFLLLSVFAACACAQQFDYDGITYQISSETNKTCEVTSGEVSGNVTIPEIVIYKETQYTVSSIDTYAFFRCDNLSSIILPETITSIGMFAFYECKNLTSISIPGKLISIEAGTFSGCSSLSSISLPESLISIEENAFNGCCNLSSITLPETLTSIGNHAFEGCSSLASIFIPHNINSIGERVFSGCYNLTVINVGEENKNYASIDGVLFSKDVETLLTYPEGKSGEYNVPEGVTSIEDYAFYGCRNLSLISFPESLSSIGKYAFSGCTSLNSLSLPEGLVSIPDGVFDGCSSLTSISLPQNLTSIGGLSFNDCSSLTSITLPATLTSINNWAFLQCSSLTEINVAIGNKHFESNEGVLFSKDLTTLIICPGGKSNDYTVPNGVNSIGDFAFFGCSDLTSIRLPLSLTSIGQCAFFHCNSLSSISLPKNLTTIDSSAFEGCESLSFVSLPPSLLSIESLSFYKCKNLQTVNSYATTPPAFGDGAFDEIAEDAVLHVPVGTKDEYAAANGWSAFRTIIDDLTEEAGVEEIGAETFENNSDEVIEIFNLQGYRISIGQRSELQSLPAGIYIVNGKKVLIK